MSIPHRLQVKLFFEEGGDVPPPQFLSVFHRWIQHGSVEDMLIDVHNYSHIPDGPGMLLVGHEGDYALDFSDGLPGIMYRLKRGEKGELSAALEKALRRAARAAELIEQDVALRGKVRIGTEFLEIRIIDRLRYPNESETAVAILDEMSSVVRAWCGDSSATVKRIDNDAREPLALRVAIPTAPPLSELTGESASARIA